MYQVEEEYVDKVARFINGGDPHYGRKEGRSMSDGMTDAMLDA